ncbi:MAG: hypothetical protein IKG27_04855 [Bacilli bacterium]|nr:hypothetical protein [Bacilli bacterium]
MKKIIPFLILFLLLPLNVKADNSPVKITKVELLEKTENTEILAEPVVENIMVDFNLRFSEVEDKATYMIVLKNESNKSYEISNEIKYSDDNYIKYEFSFDDNNVIKAGETKNMYVMISYDKEVPAANFTEGKYTVNKAVVVEMVNDTVVVSVPNTVSNSVIRNVAIVTTVIVIIALIILVKSKKSVSAIILCLLLIPFTVYALEKISIEIKAKIEIEENPIRRVYAINENIITKNTSTLQDIGTTYNNCTSTGKNVCLRYTIENDIVAESEVCFIKEGHEYCIKGSDGFVNNTDKLLSIFAEQNACTGHDGGSFHCVSPDINAMVEADGDVIASEGVWHCDINYVQASCAEGWPVA